MSEFPQQHLGHHVGPPSTTLEVHQDADLFSVLKRLASTWKWASVCESSE